MIHIFRNWLFFFILVFIPHLSYEEGIKELTTDSTVSHADLYFIHYTYPGSYPNFATLNCDPNYRLYIHVKSPGESILFGLNAPPYGYNYHLRKPDGTIVLSGSCPSTGQAGYIRYYHQAIKGPFPAIGGYNPLEYKITNIADTGNYYFELWTSGSYEIDVPLWDFQIVSGLHTPALPMDTINGRVWSQSWQFDADLGSYFVLNASLYVLSDDGIVTKLKFSQARVGVVTIFCNPTGSYNTGNPVYDRKSYAINTFTTFPAIAQYKVFINNPDTSVYRSGVFGSINGPPGMIPDPAFPACSGHELIVVNVDKPGNAEIDLTFPYGAPATNVSLFATLTAGTNHIAWNGNDGMNNPVPDGTPVNIRVIYTNGLTNLPIWDQEQNPDGFQITLVRPPNPAFQVPLTFWDDSNITEYLCPQSTNLTGCLPYPTGCHVWGGGYDCHDKMINTWWYGSSDTAVNVALFARMPLAAIGYDSSRCGPGSVTLHASVPANETVDWYDSITGGTPLLIGNTTFVTPVISNTTTYYAEARTDSTVCTSVTRTPVQAIIKPITIPRLFGPRLVCDSATGIHYSTDALMTNYIWTISPGNLITGGLGTNHITVSWLVEGVQQLTVNYDNPGGCPGPATWRFVDVEPWPDNAGPLTGPDKVCAGTNGLVYSVGPIANATSYNWTVPAGVIIVSGNGTNTITVDFPPNAQSGYFSVFGKDSCGNGNPFIYPVTVYQPPQANAGPSDTICQDDSFRVSHATASSYSGILWTTSGNGILSEDTTLTPTYHPGSSESGIVTLTMIVRGNAPCGNDTSRMTLLINKKAIVDAGPDETVCEGRSYFITSAMASNYQNVAWKTSGSGQFNNPYLLNPEYIPGSGDLQNGSVILSLHVSPLFSCPATSDSMKLTFIKAPLVSAGPAAITCEYYPVIVTGTASNYDSLVWSHNGHGLLTGESTLTPTYSPANGETGIILLTLKVYGKLACADSIVMAQTEIIVYPSVVANAGTDREIPSGSVDTLSGSIWGGSGSYSFNWSPVSMLQDYSVIDPITVPLVADASFILSVTDKITNCTTTDIVHIRIKKPVTLDYDCIVVYNVITPNGDGLNDRWVIDCIENFPENKVEIFNEWGDIVGKYTQYDNVNTVWKGTDLHGLQVPDGTYYYVITIKGQKLRVGWILVRGGWK